MGDIIHVLCAESVLIWRIFGVGGAGTILRYRMYFVAIAVICGHTLPRPRLAWRILDSATH